MSKTTRKTVVAVRADEDNFDISFDEKALAKLGQQKAEILLRTLHTYSEAYVDLVRSESELGKAKKNWAHINGEGKYELPKPDDFDDDMLF